MNRNIQIVYIVFACVCLFAIIAFFGVRTYISRNKGIAAAEAQFESLENTVISSYLARGGYRSDYFSSRISDFFQKHPACEVLIIHSGGSTEYLYARSEQFLHASYSEAGVWRGPDSLNYKPFFRRYLQSSISLPGSEDTVQGLLVTAFPQELLYLYLRDSLIALVALLLITAIFLIVISGEKKYVQGSAWQSAAASPSSPVTSAEDLPAAVSPAEQSAEKKEGCGLFSPETGLGWENYLEKRLSFELRRAASFDQDLSLFLLRTDRFDKDSQGYRTIAKSLLSKFSFQDLIFEYKKNGFAVILPNTDIDGALREAEEFLAKHCGKLSAEGCFFAAGLSSRNGRLINGSRIINEAAQALHKAETDPEHHIIAFRSDPEKYRQYVASKV